MKKKNLLSPLLLLLCMALAVPAMLAKGEKGDVRFAYTTYDFGIIPEKGGPVSCTFEFTNDGLGNVIITDATAQCGCTRPQFPEAPVKPGKKSKIKVTFNPAGRPGAFSKNVTVRLSGDRKKKVILKIKGTVKR